MSEFDSRIGRDSSESEDRSSRSDRVVHTSGESWDTIRPALSVPNQCPPQMIEIQISCKMCQIRIKVLMEHFRSFCNQPNIHQMCQGIHFKRHWGKGWVQKVTGSLIYTNECSERVACFHGSLHHRSSKSGHW